MTQPWAPERVKKLGLLCARGLSYTAIGRVLGCSRNAVIGKAMRLGIDNGHRKDGSAPRVPRERRARVVAVVAPPPAPPEPIGPLGDFPPQGTCRFIADEVTGRAWRCCGHPVEDRGEARSAWCAYHRSKVYSRVATAEANRKRDERQAERDTRAAQAGKRWAV